MTRPQRGKDDEHLAVAVTGVSGYLGTRLVEQLDLDDRVERVLGFDIRPPSVRSEKLLYDAVDIRSDALGPRLEGVDVVVHLAFVMDPIKDEREMRDINVNGSVKVFQAAANAGAAKIVYLSSAVVYGAHPNNPLPLTEDDPLRANLDFSYAAHKLEVEYAVREFRSEHPGIVFTVFRPAIVFGRHVDNAWSHMLETPVVFGVRGYSPPLQLVHEDDVADALVFSVFEDLDDAYNLAPGDRLPAERIVEMAGKRRIELDEPRAFSMMDRLWSLGLAEAPPGMLHYVMYPWIVSIEKLTKAGFEPARTGEEALLETLERTRGVLRLGKRRILRQKLIKGAAAGAGLAGAALAARTLRRSGRRTA